MEIKHSSPSVARPVEAHPGKKRWPWVLLIVVIALIVVGGIIAALYFWGGKLISREPADTNSTNTANQTDNQPSDTGFTVDPEPDADELTFMLIGRYEDDTQQGGVKLSSADATESGTLDESSVFEYEPKLEDATTELALSPNGQFVVVYEHEVPATGPTKDLASVLTLVDITTKEQTTIADDFTGVPSLPLWTPDSERLIYMDTDAEADSTQSLNVYTVESGQTMTVTDEVAEGEFELLLPIKATENDLFVIKTTGGSENPGELGVLSLSDNGEIGTDFEKLIDMSAASRGIDVSSDGRSIAIARGTGSGLGDSDNGPFMLELLDRSTGEIEELRESTSEKYSAPRFSRDGESLIYGAASGVWKLDFDSGDRTQLVESNEFDNLSSGVIEPRSISPNGDIVLIAVPFDIDAFEFYSVPTDSEKAAFDDLGAVDAKEDGRVDVFGWVI